LCFLLLFPLAVCALDIAPEHRDYDKDMIWLIPLFVISLLALIVIRVLQNNRLEYIVLTSLRLKPVYSQGEEMTFTSATSLLLNFGSICMYGLLFYEGFRFFVDDSLYKGFSAYLVVCAIYSCWMIYRIFSLWLVQFITDSDVGLVEIRYNYILLNQLGALLFLPVLTLATISNIGWIVEISIWIGVSIFFLIELIRFYRSLILSFSKGISPFYFILYICALEILPLIVVIKLFVG
jgi:hypothetical protein